jgi:hypothetical protein
MWRLFRLFLLVLFLLQKRLHYHICLLVTTASSGIDAMLICKSLNPLTFLSTVLPVASALSLIIGFNFAAALWLLPAALFNAYHLAVSHPMKASRIAVLKTYHFSPGKAFCILRVFVCLWLLPAAVFNAYHLAVSHTLKASRITVLKTITSL